MGKETELGSEEQAMDKLIGAEAAALRDDDEDDAPAVPDDAPVAKVADTEEADEVEEEQPETAAEEGVEAAADEELPAGDVVERAPVYMQLPDISDIEERQKTLDTQKSDARRAHADGDIDRDEYERRLDEVAAAQRELDRLQMRYETAIDYNRRLDLSIYMGAIAAQKRVARSDGIDYDTNPALMAAWDSRVKALAKDEAWVKKGDAAILAQAHKEVLQAVRGTAEKLGLREESPGTKPTTVRDALDKRKPNVKSVRPMAKMPAAALSDPREEGEFAHLAGKDGLELEAALAAMSPADAERYLRG